MPDNEAGAPAPVADNDTSKTRRQRPLVHRLALLHAGLVTMVVLCALPFAFQSMGEQLLDPQQHTLYRFPSGTPITEQQAESEPANLSYYNIAAVELDEAAGSLTLAISGHRKCGDACAKMTITVVSLNDDSHYRRALPPSAEIELEPDDRIYTQTVDLPIRGQPSLYPFDDYWLWLGLAGTVEENGTPTPLTEELLAEHALITTQNQLRDFRMAPPRQIDPDAVTAPTDPEDFFGVQELRFDRPIHQEILTALLVVLVGISAIIAVAMRTITDLVFGIGGLILAVWGVKRILVPDALPVLTTVDMSLSIIILLVLVVLTIRGAWHVSTGTDPTSLPGRWRGPK